MSDIIKNRYKKEFEQIKPSEEFLNNLTDTLENEQTHKKYSKIVFSKRIIAVTAAACIVTILCGAAIISALAGISMSENVNNRPSQSYNNIEHRYENVETDTMPSKPVSPGMLFGDDMTAEQCAEIFMDKAGTEELSYIKVSDSNVFTSAQECDEEQKNLLFDLLDSGKNVDSIPDGEKSYYMAVFTDGKIVKLIVTDGRYLEFSGTGKYLYAE